MCDSVNIEALGPALVSTDVLSPQVRVKLSDGRTLRPWGSAYYKAAKQCHPAKDTTYGTDMRELKWY